MHCVLIAVQSSAEGHQGLFDENITVPDAKFKIAFD